MTFSAAWELVIVILLLGTGIFLTVKCGAIQLTKFKYAIANTIGKIFSGKAREGEMTPMQAVSTALGATVGTGNISGVIAAITMGGPGALFWLWVSGIIGMCTKYTEVLLAVKFRERNREGEWAGGPMYYIKNGLGDKWYPLSVLFCISGAIAAFGIGNAIQIGNINDAIGVAVRQLCPNWAFPKTALCLIIGTVSAILVGITSFGGIKRLGRVAEMLVPLVSAVYIISCLGVIIANIGSLGSVFCAVFKGAFDPKSVVGGAAGITVKSCITAGVNRGVFSNEAGLGSSPIAHATTSESNPVKQGMYGIFEVFADTIVICTLTGLAVLMGCDTINYGTALGNDVIISALGKVVGGKPAVIIIAGSIAFFALLTVLGWSLYGIRCCEFVLGPKSVKPYKLVFALACVIGSVLDLRLAWSISDTLNGFMAVPNLIALLALSGTAAKITKSHFDRNNS